MKPEKTITIIFFMILAGIIIWNASKSPLERIVSSCSQYALPYWKLDYVIENAEEKHIKIVYNQSAWGNADEQVPCTKDTVNALCEKLLKDLESSYHDYVIDVHFSIVNGAENLEVYNLTADLSDVRIRNTMTSIALKEIVACFPFAKELYVDGVDYHDTIEDIQGFEDLKYFNITLNLTEEEKEYISSLYPDCVIEDSEKR